MLVLEECSFIQITMKASVRKILAEMSPALNCRRTSTKRTGAEERRARESTSPRLQKS